jgi:thymidylate synthase
MEEMGVTWWGDCDIGDGTIGQRYGATVKHYDLLNRLIEDIKNDPYGRRKVMSMWQEDDLRSGPGLAPCAFMTIWNVRGNFLDMALIQRSGDMLTASGPGGINETQYAALLMMIARHTGYEPGRFSHFVANEHIYDRHLEQAEIMASRYYERLENQNNNGDIEEWVWPMLHINPEKTNFYDLTIDDFTMENYESMKPQLKFDLGI